MTVAESSATVQRVAAAQCEGQQAKHQRRDRCQRSEQYFGVKCIARAHSSLRGSVDILGCRGNIGCALAPKICEGARVPETSKTQKVFRRIPSGLSCIQIINLLIKDPESNLGKLKD